VKVDVVNILIINSISTVPQPIKTPQYFNPIANIPNKKGGNIN
jgi:hypothetical protein